jgi:Superfamily II DNA/RNA helicases, SNF2 family
MKISKSAIKYASSPQSYKRGNQLWQDGAVYNIREELGEMEDTLHLSAEVRGSAGYDYHVSVDYDATTQLIYEEWCECPAYFKYDKMCKHCVALALEFVETEEIELEQFSFESFLKKTRMMPKRVETSPELESLIYAYSMEDKARYLQLDMTGSIELVPTLHIDYREWSIDFKIGNQTKYVLKDIHSFLGAVENRGKVEYGKKLGFIHEMSVFTKESQVIIEFLKKYVAEYSYHTSGNSYFTTYRYEAAMRKFSLSNDAKAEFINIMMNKNILLEDVYTNNQSMIVKEGNPKLHFALEEKSKEEGFELKVPPMSAFYGNKRLYIRKKEMIYECDSLFSEKMKNICTLGEINYTKELIINEKDMNSLCSSVLPILQEYARLDVKGELERFLPVDASIKIYLDYQMNYIMAKLEAHYGEESYNILGEFKVSDAYRDTKRESYVAHTVQQYFEGRTLDNDLYIPEDAEDKIYKLLTTGIEQISQLGELYVSEGFKKLKVTKTPKVAVGISLAGDMLDLQIDAGRLSAEELERFLDSYRKRRKYFRLKNGDFMEIEDNSGASISELAEGLDLDGKDLAKGNIQIPRYRAFFIDQTLKEQGENVETSRNSSFKKLIRNMNVVEDSDFEVPNFLRSVLRKYQKTGFRWLCTLATMGFGGILADDMGLGKTLQIISFLLNQKEQSDKKHTSLIICPASLVYNWQSEIEKFAPELSVLMQVGNAGERKSQLENYEDYDVVITSYDLLKRDIELYKKLAFYVEIIDEAQNIKNHITQAAKAVREIRATVKFALTGTPIENRLSELWSIFEYLMPGFLGKYKDFKADYEVPIALNKDELITKRLQKMIKPFILRRIKSDVLKELPGKEEHVVYTKLTGEQFALYNGHVQRMLDELAGQTENEFTNGKIQILAQLTRLRQLCCAPEMVYENYQGETAKLDTCMELIKNSVEGGHKILVFSQFTSLFNLLEKRLEAERLEYYKLTGATPKKERALLVEDFNQNEVPIFLISLKAGGTGLNLTGANIVIHFDPWWNVAAQNQATDRAYRIGQTNEVSVFKLIAKNTIEEKILKLQEAKKDLSNQIMSGEGISVTGLTKEDFMGILEA